MAGKSKGFEMKIAVAVALVVLAGNAMAAPEATPTCSGQFQCEAMWNAAQRGVAMISDMRLRLVTDSRLETYAPMRAGSVGAVVTKEPVSPGVYSTDLQIVCYSDLPCDDLSESGTRLFNMIVNQAIRAAQPKN